MANAGKNIEGGDKPVPEEIISEQPAEIVESKAEVSDFDAGKIEAFRDEIKQLKTTETDNHIQNLDVEHLGDKEMKLWKYLKKFAGEKWPKPRLSEFDSKLNQYDFEVLKPLSESKSSSDPEVKSKHNFYAFLRTKLVVASTENK